MNDWLWTRIRQLAPDDAVLARAYQLGKASGRWYDSGRLGEWHWSAYSAPSGRGCQVAVRLTEQPTLHCNCEERTRPCAHSLALLILLMGEQLAFPYRETGPPWLRALMSPPTPASLPSPPSDRKRAERAQLVTDGIHNLHQWLTDVVRQGIATLPQRTAELEQMATHLTDSKASGLASQVRRMLLLLQQEEWTAPVTALLGQLYFTVRSWAGRDQLSPAAHYDLLAYVGINLQRQEVLQQPVILDHWWVIGSKLGQEAMLHYRRTWLLGHRTGHTALLLDFAFGQAVFEQPWATASAWQGALHYYPSAWPQRAVLATATPANPEPLSPLAHDMGADLTVLATSLRQALRHNPWINQILVGVTGVYLRQRAEQWCLQDRAGHTVLLPHPFTGVWTLLAHCGTEPLTLFGEWDGNLYLPLSVIVNDQLISIDQNHLP